MDLISQIKNYYSLPAVVAPYTGGLNPPQQTTWDGIYINGWCPWCQSGQRQRGQPKRFWVNTKAKICNCFHPACRNDKPMDVINFWARLWSLTNEQAIQDLKRGMAK